MTASWAASLESALEAEGYRVHTAEVAGRPAVIGQRKLFRLRWLATQLKVTVVASHADELSGEDWQHTVTSGFELAKRAPGLPNGLQSGSALVCVLVVDRPSAEAISLAESLPLRKWFKGITSSALINAGTGQVHTYDGRQVVGRVYTAFMRSQRDLVVRALTSETTTP